MAIYEGGKLAQEELFEVAKLCAIAVYKAPQITGLMKYQTMVITGEDLEPIIEALAALGRTWAFCLLSFMMWNPLYLEGRPPVLLLIGGNLRQSELNWNCGACGFKNCAEFNRYAKEIKPPARYMMQGPTCHWKLIDYSIACDWACAAAWHYNITNRIEAATGMAAAAVGYLENCSILLGLPLGPCEDLYWYNRPILKDMIPYEMTWERMRLDFSSLFGTFKGHGRPEAKVTDDWWKSLKLFSTEYWDPKIMKGLREDVARDLERIKQKRLEKERQKKKEKS